LRSRRDTYSLAGAGDLQAARRSSNFMSPRETGVRLALAVGFGIVCLLVAQAGAAVAACPNEAFRTGPGAFLPDCRAYEQASPVDKNGAGVGGLRGYLRAAPEGAAITFFNSAGTGFPSETGGNQTFGTYLASKSAESWSLRRLMAPEIYGTSNSSSWLGSTPDLQYSLVEVENPAYESPEFGRGLYLIDNSTGGVTTVVPNSANRLRTPYAFDGASKDGSRIFFETLANLTAGSHEFVDNLYVWDRATGKVTLAGVLPASEGGEEPAAGTFGGAYEWFEEHEQTFSGGALQGLAVEAAHAISPNGDQIYFTAGETGQLYLSRGLTGPTPASVRVSQPETGAPVEPPLPAAFQEATPDGSQAFFISSQKLTADATTGPANEGKDLYRWNAASGKLVDIAPDTVDPAGAQVRGLVGIAEDGRSGYFVAEGALATGATFGSQNLYRFVEAGSSFEIAFVATLAPNEGEITTDQRNYSPKLYAGPASGGDRNDDRSKVSRTLPDGSDLLFSSIEPLTGYENVSGENTRETRICNQGSEHRCAELFLYSATTGVVTCISCDPNGDPPLGSALLSSEYFNTALAPNDFPNVSLPRNLSSDGSRVFFQSPDPLVSRDTNAASGCTSANEVNAPETSRDCLDVYEWEAPGAAGGSCQAAEVNEGCLYLLSTGQSTSASYFLDASRDGSNAFIGTTSKLVPSDRDSVFDAYDVKVEGGVASQFQLGPIPCEPEGCLGPAAPPPAAENPASSQLEGPGNIKQHKKKQHKKKQHKKKQHKAKSRPGNHGRPGNIIGKGGK
jgi:hypothetical protein